MDMTGSRVLVTGAASGIGRATALRFADRGAGRIACLDLHEGGAAETLDQLRAQGAEAAAFKVDLGDVASIQAAYADAVAWLGGLDAAAHIGGYSWRGETLDVTPEQWDQVTNVNLRGAFFCSQAALRVMYGQGSGAIVNMSADAAFHPMHGFAVQAAAKGGVALMSQTLAMESARRGVRVNAISPGIVKVRPTGVSRPDSPTLRPVEGQAPPPPIEDLAEQTVTGRYSLAEEIADAVVYLSAPAASAVNGVILPVNGGGYFSLRY